MLGPVGMDTHPPSKMALTTLKRFSSRTMEVALLRWSWRDLLPSARAFLHIRVIAVRGAAEIPVTGRQALLRALLDIRRRRRDHRRIVIRVIRRIVIVIGRWIPDRSADENADVPV